MDAATTIRDAAQALQSAAASMPRQRAWLGLDGFVDEIVRVVRTRRAADDYDPIDSVAEYAGRIGAASGGKSTNVEFVTQEIKIGGNGPLMAQAVGALGAELCYVGAVGWPELHPVYEPLRRFGSLNPIAPPGITLAAEFGDDGKIMHGRMEGLRDVTYDNMAARLGGTEGLRNTLRGCGLVAILNWTMLPHLTDILRRMRADVEALGAEAPRIAFFDLCDPAKRPVADLVDALRVMASYSSKHTTAILGLNEKESESVCDALGVDRGGNDGAGQLARARAVAEALAISEVVIHPTRLASAWGAAGSGSVDGPYCKNPKLTTGAGDHFNGGYATARMLGLPPARAVVVGKAVSGFYVRTGTGPSVAELRAFCDRWADGSLDS
ncbi:MAG: carbohydrate kinase family protein [Candidatus Sumerlaeia bacterium]|nr:carbohydrate kinase family protein [Candidatus Sumerlaeia bacterium]